jgi:hypothetical protein
MLKSVRRVPVPVPAADDSSDDDALACSSISLSSLGHTQRLVDEVQYNLDGMMDFSAGIAARRDCVRLIFERVCESRGLEVLLRGRGITNDLLRIPALLGRARAECAAEESGSASPGSADDFGYNMHLLALVLVLSYSGFKIACSNDHADSEIKFKRIGAEGKSVELPSNTFSALLSYIIYTSKYTIQNSIFSLSSTNNDKCDNNSENASPVKGHFHKRRKLFGNSIMMENVSTVSCLQLPCSTRDLNDLEINLDLPNSLTPSGIDKPISTVRDTLLSKFLWCRLLYDIAKPIVSNVGVTGASSCNFSVLAGLDLQYCESVTLSMFALLCTSRFLHSKVFQ